MDKNTIQSLREALNVSPDNVPLRLHLANSLLEANMLDDAEIEFKTILSQENNIKAKVGLANVYFEKGECSTAIVILEEVIGKDRNNFNAQLLYTRALVKEQSIQQAINSYKKVLAMDPNFKDDELDAALKVTYRESDDEYDFDEDEIAHFLEKPDVNFSSVGGMDNVKREIDLKIIQPLKNPEIYKAYGKKIGGGILLYGPPGCGKTFIAKATAGQVDANFISVSLNDILDMWMGNSEKNLHEIFEIARENTPCVLFFDEIDALGASRSDMKQSSGRHLINQFLQELDGLESNNEGVLIVGATNTPWHLDTAFRRPGRFDRIIFIPPPDTDAREEIFKLKLKDKPIESINYASLSKKTKDYSGADIEAVIDIAIEGKLHDALRDGVPKPLTTKDLEEAVKKHKATTKEWFASAKNFALYANESGLYDDILQYLNIRK